MYNRIRISPSKAKTLLVPEDNSSQLNFDAENRMSIDPVQIEPVYLRPFSGQYYSVRVDDIVVNSPSLMGEPISLSALPPGDKCCFYQTGPKSSCEA